MRISSVLAAVCACLFGLLLLSGDPAFGTLLAWAMVIGVFVFVVEAVLTLTGAIKFFSRPPR